MTVLIRVHLRSSAAILIFCIFLASAQTTDTTTTFSTSIIVVGSVQRDSPADDATLPSDVHLAIQCHSVIYDAGSPNQSGQFTYTQRPDPAVIRGAGECAVEAKAFGYESTVAKFSARSVTGLLNIGALTITAREQSKERTGTTVSATSLRAPPNAKKFYDHGMRSVQQQKFPEGF